MTELTQWTSYTLYSLQTLYKNLSLDISSQETLHYEVIIHSKLYQEFIYYEKSIENEDNTHSIHQNALNLMYIFCCCAQKYECWSEDKGGL